MDKYGINYAKQKCECKSPSLCKPPDCKCASGYMNFECNSHCSCHEEAKESCVNKVIQLGIQSSLEVKFISE